MKRAVDTNMGPVLHKTEFLTGSLSNISDNTCDNPQSRIRTGCL